MAEWRGYIGIEWLQPNLVEQRELLIAELKRLGRKQGGATHERMQARPIRADRQAAIFEAVFENSHLTITATKTRLAAIFGVSVGSINHVVNVTSFGNGSSTVVTFSRLGVNYLRAVIFGGINSTWEESNAEALAFIALDLPGWSDLSPDPDV